MAEQWFGFDLKARKVALFDDGNTRIKRQYVVAMRTGYCGSAQLAGKWKISNALQLEEQAVVHRQL